MDQALYADKNVGAFHPRKVLWGSHFGGIRLPVCDHYSGVEVRMRKSLQLQAEMTQEFGTCVFDVTLDCEDGAPVGGEAEHAALVTELALGAAPQARVAVRVHPVDHPSFLADVAAIAGHAAQRLTHMMVPKVESLADVQAAEKALNLAGAADLPLHVLIESPAAVHRAFEIAAHPRVQSISFGLMDFVSAHGGAIPASAMRSETGTNGSDLGQFSHPLVLRAKLEIASACHAHGKVPSHCVVTEYKNTDAVRLAAHKASQALGYTRMWSIHPDQIRPILEAMAPSEAQIDQASQIILAAHAAQWGPISQAGQLHDRASYRFFWQLIERAHQTGRRLPQEVQLFFTGLNAPTGSLA
jgi:citrate lyase subunit beta/citryl-CoA lyase